MQSAMPGIAMTNGAKRIKGASISKKIPIITESKQKANHDNRAIIETPQIVKPDIKLVTPTITFIFLPNYRVRQRKKQ